MLLLNLMMQMKLLLVTEQQHYSQKPQTLTMSSYMEIMNITMVMNIATDVELGHLIVVVMMKLMVGQQDVDIIQKNQAIFCQLLVRQEISHT